MIFILRTDAHKAHCLETISKLVGVWEVDIREYRKRRTNNANSRYFAAVVTPMARHLGYDVDTMHTLIKAKIFGVEEVEVGGVKVERPRKRTRDLNTKEFSDFVIHAEAWAADLGVPFEAY